MTDFRTLRGFFALCKRATLFVRKIAKKMVSGSNGTCLGLASQKGGALFLLAVNN
jgi:hypothetical protein